MNFFSGVLQVLLAVHTLIGAVWKFSKNAEQAMTSLKAIPNGVWFSMGIVEILCSITLLLPFLNKQLSFLAPIGAILIAIEMLAMSGVHVASVVANYGPIVYWLVVAMVSGFIAYERMA